MTFELRPIEEKDNLAAKELIQTTLVEFGLNLPGTAYFDPELDHLAQHYQVNRAQYWVLTQDEEILGGIGIYPLNESTCEVQKLYLRKEVRGQGLGGKLLRQALDFAAKRYRYAYLDTRSELSDAIAMYKKYGFKELDVAPEHSSHNFMDHWFILELGG